MVEWFMGVGKLSGLGISVFLFLGFIFCIIWLNSVFVCLFVFGCLVSVFSCLFLGVMFDVVCESGVFLWELVDLGILLSSFGLFFAIVFGVEGFVVCSGDVEGCNNLERFFLMIWGVKVFFVVVWIFVWVLLVVGFVFDSLDFGLNLDSFISFLDLMYVFNYLWVVILRF